MVNINQKAIHSLFTNTFILDSYSFEALTFTRMKTGSITSTLYKTMLQNYAIPELQQGKIINDTVWMQNSAHSMSPDLFDKCCNCNSTLMIDSFLVPLQFRCHHDPWTLHQWISDSGVISNQRYTHQTREICQNWMML